MADLEQNNYPISKTNEVSCCYFLSLIEFHIWSDTIYLANKSCGLCFYFQVSDSEMKDLEHDVCPFKQFGKLS